MLFWRRESKKDSTYKVIISKNPLILGICFLLLAIAQISCIVISRSRYEATACQFYPESTREIEYGNIRVPEYRSNSDAPIVELYFDIIPSNTDEKMQDPVSVLHGGPCGNALDLIDIWILALEKSLSFRDIIVLEQRGTGCSIPSLNCPKLEDPYYEHYDENLTSEESV